MGGSDYLHSDSHSRGGRDCCRLAKTKSYDPRRVFYPDRFQGPTKTETLRHSLDYRPECLRLWEVFYVADKILKITRAMATERLGFCRKGLRAFIENNGLDWQEFCGEGISIETARKIDDYRVRALIQELEK